MKKHILYLDMDGVLADFDAGVKQFDPDLCTSFKNTVNLPNRIERVNKICEYFPDIFHGLPIIPGAIESAKELMEIYNVYFLSTPMYNVPKSMEGKQYWLHKHFGHAAAKRLILTHNKGLNVGRFLVDDRVVNGVESFNGEHIHFGTDKFPGWVEVLEYLKLNNY